MMAYVRRKRLEAMLLATELAKLLGGRSAAASGANDRMHSDDVLKMMGLSL